MFVLNPWTHFQVQFVAYAPPLKSHPSPGSLGSLCLRQFYWIWPLLCLSLEL